MELYKNAERKNYSWGFPLIGGILTIIGMLLPTASFDYSGTSWSWWMWDFSVMSVSGYGSISVFITETDFILPSMITSIAIFFCAINLFLLANTN